MDGEIGVLLVEDHPLYRKALRPVVENLGRPVKVKEASSILEALQAVEENDRLDLVLLDLALPDGNGLKALLPLVQALPEVPVVVVSASESRELVIQVLNAGARGFIPKSADSRVMENALMLVLNGETYVPSIALEGPGEEVSLPGSGETDVRLTPRQDEVLQLLAKGYSNKQIARDLDIAETTVRAHVSDILHHLKAHNRTDAVVKAQQLGLL